MEKKTDWLKETFHGFYSLILVVCYSQAAIALIFSGVINPILPFGLAAGFLGICIIDLFYGLRSHFPVSLAATSPTLGALSTLMVADIAHRVSPAEVIPTSMASLIIMSMLVGLSIILSGPTGLSRLLRFSPYPVISGFLVVTGWTILTGSLPVMAQDLVVKPNLFDLLIGNWLGIVFGLVLFISTKFIKTTYSYLIVILFGIIAINGYLFFSGMSHEQAIAKGLFLKNMHISFMFKEWDARSLMNINWRAVYSQINYYAVLVITSLLIQSNRLSSLERTSVNPQLLNKEIHSCGIAIFISSLIGSIVTGPNTAIGYLLSNLKVKTRIPLAINIIFILILILFLPGSLTYVPKAVLVGLLIFSALEILYGSLYKSFWHLPFGDYMIIIIMLLTRIFFGFMESILLGVIFACSFFLFKYSRIENIKYELTGEETHSKHKYPLSVEKKLREIGRKTLILKLQGYLFFGSSRRLLERIYDQLKSSSKGEYKNLILDFQFVTGVDASGVKNFITLAEIAKKYELNFIVADCSSDIIRSLQTMAEETSWLKKNIITMPNLDYAEEWAEKHLLKNTKIDVQADLDMLLKEQKHQTKFLSYLEKKEFLQGSNLFKQGEPSKSLYYLISGQVTGYLETSDKSKIRLFTAERDVLIGEMGFFSDEPRSATVVADKLSIAYELTRDKLELIERENPELAEEFFQSVIRLLSSRIVILNHDLELFQK